MTLLQFRPVDGRLDEILSMLMHSREVASHPSLSYAIRLVSEEIIVNILNYAYPQQAEGYLTLCLWDEDGEITLEFIDGGIPFNPLDKADPDISLPLEQREIGGLGIFLVREMMDDVAYTYVNKENRLTIKRNICNPLMNLYHDQVKRKYHPLDHCRSLYTFDSMSGPIPGISSFGIGQGASCSVSGGIPG